MPSFHIIRPPVELGTPVDRYGGEFAQSSAKPPASTSEPIPSPYHRDAVDAGPSSRPYSTVSPEWMYDPQSPLTVMQVTGISMVSAGALGAGWSFYREFSPFLGAHNLSKNAAIVSITYIGLREYLVLPLSRLSGIPDSIKRFTETTFSDQGARLMQVRLDKLPETFAASLVAGIGLARLHYSPVDRATRNAGILALVLLTCSCQGAFNLWRAHRLKRLIGSDEPLFAAKKETKPLSLRVTEMMQAMVPLKKLTDEEYLDILEAQRTVIDTRIENISLEERALRQRPEAADRNA